MKETNLPLGREIRYPQQYAPEVLCPIARATGRADLDIRSTLPFSGIDIWNAWDLTWLAPGGQPRVATAEIRVPAESPSIIESKSLKLYLGSLAMSTFDDAAAVADCLVRDLAACVGAPVDVGILPVADTQARPVARLAGTCLDDLDVNCTTWQVDATLLRSEASSPVREDLHTHLLRSLCPVTAQPDIGSLQISYRGPQIDHRSLLRYVVSFREHNDFHEACIERMFVDLMDRCACEELTVQARYQRRGGIDINPMRSNCGDAGLNLRLWRQ